MKVEKSRENLKKCICLKCPSYSMYCKVTSMPLGIVHMIEGIEKQEHFEGLFCAFGKSGCIKDNKGCVCPQCELTKQYDLKEVGFCFHSAAK